MLLWAFSISLGLFIGGMWYNEFESDNVKTYFYEHFFTWVRVLGLFGVIITFVIGFMNFLCNIDNSEVNTLTQENEALKEQLASYVTMVTEENNKDIKE